MNKADKEIYDKFLWNTANRLGISKKGDLEKNIIKFCENFVKERIAGFGEKPKTLDNLLGTVSSLMNVRVEEIHNENDLKQLLVKFPPQKIPVMSQVSNELDEKTDAIMVWLKDCQPWEAPYLAIVNCQGRHLLRRYFTTWHEIAHLLVDGRQHQMVFRRTPKFKKESEEILVDKVAGELAFYPEIFTPAFNEEFKKEGRLTFELVERIRDKYCPAASFQSTLIACLKNCKDPTFFITAKPGYKKTEEQLISSKQALLFPNRETKPSRKLRIVTAMPNDAISKNGIRFFKNMEIPKDSVIWKAFSNQTKTTASEFLSAWKTSDGPIGFGDLQVEAMPIDKEVWALIRFKKGVRSRK